MSFIINPYSFASGGGNSLLNGLVSYYKCDTNGSFPDAHGSNDGTINGATYTASGKLNGAYSYDGVNDSVSTGYTSPNLYTLSCWFKTTMTTRGGLMYFQTTLTPLITIEVNAITVGKALFSHHDSVNSAVGESTTTINDGNWHHIVFVRSASNDHRLYIDGVLEATDTTTTNNISKPLYIGVRPDTPRFFFDGIIDEIGIWNKALTTDEITALYNSGSGLPYSSFTS